MIQIYNKILSIESTSVEIEVTKNFEDVQLGFRVNDSYDRIESKSASFLRIIMNEVINICTSIVAEYKNEKLKFFFSANDEDGLGKKRMSLYKKYIDKLNAQSLINFEMCEIC